MFQAGQSIGRRFFLVSFVPTVVGLLGALALISSGAFTGWPQWSKTVDAASSVDLAQLSALVVIALVLALMTHPFQTALVKSVEGYRQGSLLPSAITAWGVARHERKLLKLERQTRALQLAEQNESSPFARHRDVRRRLARSAGQLTEARRSVEAARDTLPLSDRLLASRLGNSLRFWEDFAGERYGLHAVLLSPHFAAVGPEMSTKMEDARNAMDRNLRFCVVFVLLSLLATVAFINDGPYLLVAVLLSAMGHVWYAGAVRASSSYGDLAAVTVDLHRHDVLRAMGYPAPTDPEDEKLLFEILERQVRGVVDKGDASELRRRLRRAQKS